MYCHPLPAGHRFPMVKYELIPGQLLREGIITEKSLIMPAPVKAAALFGTHDESYCRRVLDLALTDREIRKIGLPLSAELVMRELLLVQGTIDCCHIALKEGISLNVAGGTHHAFRDKGEGFCIFNDFAVAANYLLLNGLAKKILIADLDVHQGNGTAGKKAGFLPSACTAGKTTPCTKRDQTLI
jgi:acetoin utilization deacetylase AcuC-like enzyme